MSRCRSCGAAVLWCRAAASGKQMPVDLEPAEDGNLSLSVDLFGARIAVVDPYAPMPRHKSHFATCPQADQWRRDP